jgi:sensor domain CHASE-containing protein
MSILHVTKHGRKAAFKIEDGKSGSLHRYVDLDTGQMYYFMGKQIAGKPIDPNGVLGQKLLRTAEKLMKGQPPPVKIDERRLKQWKVLGWIVVAVLVLWLALR